MTSNQNRKLATIFFTNIKGNTSLLPSILFIFNSLLTSCTSSNHHTNIEQEALLEFLKKMEKLLQRIFFFEQYAMNWFWVKV